MNSPPQSSTATATATTISSACASSASSESSYSSCRILYSTQSGRAKACARRAARLLSASSNTENDADAICWVENGKGTSWDDDEAFSAVTDLAIHLRHPTPSTTPITSTTTRRLLLLFISTTGDGEHTVRMRTRLRDGLVRTSERTNHSLVALFPILIRIPFKEHGSNCTCVPLLALARVHYPYRCAVSAGERRAILSHCLFLFVSVLFRLRFLDTKPSHFPFPSA